MCRLIVRAGLDAVLQNPAFKLAVSTPNTDLCEIPRLGQERYLIALHETTDLVSAWSGSTNDG